MIRLAELLPKDLVNGTGNTPWDIPSWAFKPDGWSFAFLRGLQKITFAGTIWEIGVGTGLNSHMIHRWTPTARVYFSDYNPKCTELALRNLKMADLFLSDQLCPLFGQWDLVRRVDQQARAPKVDSVVACIPQVPAPLNIDLCESDNLAHYYDTVRYEGVELNALGLGLNEALLQRAHNVLTSSGRVILNLGGRPGQARLEGMFAACGYTPRIVHEEVVPQHTGTSLATLATMEMGGAENFEFFVDEHGLERINAQAAEQRRLDELSVFHKIYVIEGRKT